MFYVVGYVNNSDDCDDTQILYEDLDMDGFGSANPAACGIADSSDCDDNSNNINPNAVEILDNNVDENCDGNIETFINENQMIHLHLFPNPANHYITISPLQGMKSVSILITNQWGQKMFKGTLDANLQINTSDWANGMYNILLGTQTATFFIAR